MSTNWTHSFFNRTHFGNSSASAQNTCQPLQSQSPLSQLCPSVYLHRHRTTLRHPDRTALGFPRKSAGARHHPKIPPSNDPMLSPSSASTIVQLLAQAYKFRGSNTLCLTDLGMILSSSPSIKKDSGCLKRSKQLKKRVAAARSPRPSGSSSGLVSRISEDARGGP